VTAVRYPAAPLQTGTLPSDVLELLSDCQSRVATLKARACQGQPPGTEVNFFLLSHDDRGEIFAGNEFTSEICP
jgi:hypothetical protein